jgi:hypothetical protein
MVQYSPLQGTCQEAQICASGGLGQSASVSVDDAPRRRRYLTPLGHPGGAALPFPHYMAIIAM